jgi:hypothetical protein
VCRVACTGNLGCIILENKVFLTELGSRVLLVGDSVLYSLESGIVLCRKRVLGVSHFVENSEEVFVMLC